MTLAAADIRVRGLGRRKLGELTLKARRFGMTPERYVKRLVEEDLAISHAARTTSFEKFLGPGREVDESELDRLVDRARRDHHRRTSRRKR